VAVAKLIAVVMLLSLTFGAGLQVDREALRAVFKDGWLIARALAANVLVVPLLGLLLARLFALPAAIATGFLLMAIAPGVPFVLSSVRKRGGSLGLAVALALLLPLVSIVTVPITAAFLLPPGAQAHVPLTRFVETLLLFQILPLCAGILLTAKAPAAAMRLVRPLELLFFAAAVALLALISPQIGRDVVAVYGSHALWATFCLVALSLGVGWAMGGAARESRRVLAIGTALRNVGLCALIATANFDDPRIIATVATYLLVQAAVTTAVGIYFTRTA